MRLFGLLFPPNEYSGIELVRPNDHQKMINGSKAFSGVFVLVLLEIFLQMHQFIESGLTVYYCSICLVTFFQFVSIAQNFRLVLRNEREQTDLAGE